MKKTMSKEQAFAFAKEILGDLKDCVNDLNRHCANYNLLPVEIVTNPFMGKDGVEPMKVTSILQISVECDEQLGLLDDALNKSKEIEKP